MRQQHARSLAQMQHVRQATELIGVHLVRLHVPLLASARVIRAQGGDGHLGLRRHLRELLHVELLRAILAGPPLLATVHQQGRVRESLQLLAPFRRAPQEASVSRLQELIVLVIPLAIRHSSHYLQEALRLLAIPPSLLLAHTGVIVVHAVHVP